MPKKLTKSRPLTFVIFEILNAMERPMVHWFALYVFGCLDMIKKRGEFEMCSY